MKVSVCVATCNRPALFARSAQAILGMRPAADELLVMDQSDDGATREALLALDPGATHVHYEHLDRRGKSRALNRAIALAAGDFVALTDDDVVVDGGWLAAFLALHARMPAVDAFCGRVLPEPGTDPGDYLNLVLSEEPRRLDRKTNPVQPAFCGANLFLRRSALLHIGGYDVHFGPGGLFRSNDDGELAYRLTRAGLEVRYAPELAVVHLGWRKERENQALTHDYAFSMGGFVGYYARQGNLVPLPYFAFTCLQKTAELGLGLVLGDRLRVSDGYLHVKGFVQGFVLGLGTRKEPGDRPRPLP